MESVKDGKNLGGGGKKGIKNLLFGGEIQGKRYIYFPV